LGWIGLKIFSLISRADGGNLLYNNGLVRFFSNNWHSDAIEKIAEVLSGRIKAIFYWE
jgi:hypothetical protein